MKKLLMILSVLLALCLCLTACNLGNKNDDADDDDDVGGGGPSNRVEQNAGTSDGKQVIIDAFNSSVDVDSLMENIQTEINLEDVYAEILKINGEGTLDLTFTGYGETSALDTYIGYKNGQVAVDLSGTIDGETGSATAYGFFTEDLKYVMVVVDEYGINETEVIDFGAYLDFEDVMGALEDEESIVIWDALEDFKLPELKADDISYDDGKYVISKAYWKSVVTYTVDAMVDMAKNEGAEVDDEEFKEIKDTVNDVLDEVDLDIFFRVEGDKIVGFGMDVSVTADDLESLEEKYDLDINEEFVSANVSFDVKAKGDYIEYVDLEAKVVADAETGVGMDMDVRFDSIFDGDKIAGFKMTEKAVVTSAYSLVGTDNNGNVIEGKTVVEKATVEAEIVLDLTKADKAGSDVLKLEMDVETQSDGEIDAQIAVSASVTARGNNKFDFAFSYGDGVSAENNISASGSFAYSENATNFPSIPAYVIDAKDEALENYEIYGNEEGDEIYPEYNPGYGYDC